MNPFACSREREAAEALRRGHWPDGCSAELRNHIVACRVCSDLVLVTQTMQAGRADATASARLQSPGVLWWRAQLRRRSAAIDRIERPILGAQIFAFALILVVGSATLMWQAHHGHSIISWLEQLSGTIHFESLLPGSPEHGEGRLWILVPVLATIALVSGVVAYFASEKH
jgi:hypothetical protein